MPVTSARSPSTGTPYAWLALIALAGILLDGYLAIGFYNHGIQIPLIRYLAGDPAFQQDQVIREFAESYTTVFFPALAVLTDFVPLAILYFILFVLCRLAIVWLAYRLAVALWNDRLTALLAAVLLAVSTRLFGMEGVNVQALDHGVVAQVMMLASLLLLAQGRFVWGMALIGLMFNIHALHAAHAFGIVLVAAMATHNRRSPRVLAAGAGAALALMTPVAVWMWATTDPAGAPPPGYLDIVRSWYPLHYWPSSWGPADWIGLLVPLTAAWPVWKLSSPTRDGGLVARIALWALIAGIAGGILAEALPEPLLIRLHPMRSSWIMALAGLPLVARAVAHLLRYPADRPAAERRVAVVLGALVLFGIAVPQIRDFYWIVLIPALWAFVLGRGEPPGLIRAGWLASAGMAAVIVTVLAISWTFARAHTIDAQQQLRWTTVLAFWAALSGTALAVLARAWLFPDRPPKARTRRVFRWALISLAGALLLLNGLTMAWLQTLGPVRQWYETQRWLADHLPVGAKVLAPLSHPGVRAYSNQIPVFDLHAEGSLMVHHPARAASFRQKQLEFGYKGEQTRGNLGVERMIDRLDRSLSVQDARELGRKYGAEVAVRSTDHPAWPLAELYRNEGFVVYSLTETAP